MYTFHPNWGRWGSVQEIIKQSIGCNCSASIDSGRPRNLRLWCLPRLSRSSMWRFRSLSCKVCVSVNWCKWRIAVVWCAATFSTSCILPAIDWMLGTWEDGAMLPLCDLNSAWILWLRMPLVSRGEREREAEELREDDPMFCGCKSSGLPSLAIEGILCWRVLTG